LILVVLVSFILSAVVLGTPIYALLYLSMKLAQVKEKLMGIQSKTGKDAQENIFMKKVVYDVSAATHSSLNLSKTVPLIHVWS
jgi:cell division protein FtsL